MLKVSHLLPLMLLGTSLIAFASEHESLDFSHAVVVVSPQADRLDLKAAQVLREEIKKRTLIDLPQVTQWPTAGTPVIAIGTRAQLTSIIPSAPAAPDLKPESYSLSLQRQTQPAIIICGNDARSELYGVGRFLRKVELRPQSLSVPSDIATSSAPAYPLRGVQLGYRPKVNAYDAWSPEQFDQYIRELALFGVNSIEILPPRTDDEKTSPHMKLPPLEMMVKLAAIIDSYGLDVWIWYPNMGKDYTSEAGIQAELAEREDIFRRLVRVDHILVPGGDPGNLHPDVFFPWMERMAAVLQKYHPKAKIWVSPQAFDPTKEWLDSFYRHVNAKPAWLGGVAYAPWIATTLPEMRAIVDKALPIRNYADITHNLDCQYPVPNWDLAFALTLHRECYNPRPVAMKAIHNLFAKETCGSLYYSEGINDDVNKFVCCAQDWDPTTPVEETLRDYSRLFINPDLANEISQGFLSLEKNWDGPLAVNDQIRVTRDQWECLEQLAPPEMQEEYRFQMGLLRAHYDAYIQRRLIHETELEAEAMEVLRNSSTTGSFAAMTEAEGILRRAQTEPVDLPDKEKCFALADSLFETIGSQTSVKRSGAQNRTRGAFMDGIDEPLNNAAWLTAQFRHARELPDELSRLLAIKRILHRTDPGPGSFYDNLGTSASEHRIVNSVPWKDDPGTLRSPRVTFYYEIDRADDREIPLAWKKQADSLYGQPLRLAYDHLDPAATYTVRASYSGRTSRRMRLMANDQLLISDQIQARKPVIRDFALPHEATASGHLELEWSACEGERSCEVAEVWLLKNGVQTDYGKPGDYSSETLRATGGN